MNEIQIGDKVRLTAQTDTYYIMGRKKTVANARYNQVGVVGELNNGSVRVDFADPKPNEIVWAKLTDIERV